MSAVSRDQRHTRTHRCPICGGAEQDPRGHEKRCSGFTSEDAEWCHCSREGLAGAIEQNGAGLFAHKMHGPCKCGTSHGADLRPVTDEIEAIYDYRDEQGALLYEVVRKTGKRFPQRVPDGAGGRIWKLGSVRRVLYRLPELLASDPAAVVYVVEGEKDCNTLGSRGHLATCNPSGAGKWHLVADQARTVLQGRDVVIIADADDPGRSHARQIEHALRDVVRSVRLAEPPPPHKDVTDLLSVGGALDDLIALTEDAAPANAPTPQGNLIEIRTGLDTDRVVAQTIAALARAPNVYARGGMLVRVVVDAEDRRVKRDGCAPTIRPHTKSTLDMALSAVARFARTDDDGKTVWCVPPNKVIMAVLEAGAWPGVQPLSGVSSAPLMRADGTIAQAPGYDEASGYVLVFDSGRVVCVAENPSREEALIARDRLLAVVRDFPFQEAADESAWLAVVLTLLARVAIDGPTPMWLVTANVRGAGKSRLMDVGAIIATGRSAPRATQPADDAEAGKAFTSSIMAGDDFLLLDNVDRPLGGGKLDALLTGDRWKDRMLGGNVMIDLPIRVVLAATGNNIEVRDDTVRRVLPVRLDSPEERPEERSGFAIEGPLLAHVREHRPRLVADALTILRAWYAAGRPKAPDVRTWGSFEGWVAVVPHVLRWVHLDDPQKTRETLQEDDPKQRAMLAVVQHWNELATSCGRPNGITLREAIDKLYLGGLPSPEKRFDGIRGALETLGPGRGMQRVDARALGNVFKHVRRRVFAGQRLVEAGHDGHSGVFRWIVQGQGVKPS